MSPAARAPRNVLALFAAVTVILASAFGWLAWRLIQQDRSLEAQRTQQRLEAAADLAAGSLLRSVLDTDSQIRAVVDAPAPQLITTAGSLGDRLGNDGLLLVIGPDGFDAHPPGRLVYYPTLPTLDESSDDVFAAAEALEFVHENYTRAIATLRPLAASPDPRTRAGALVRLARNLRKTRQSRAALDSYEQLASLGPIPVAGLPAELLGRYARCELFDALAERRDLRREAEALHADLQHGRWRIDRAAYLFYSQATARWLMSSGATLVDSDTARQDELEFADGADALWEEWLKSARGEGADSGIRQIWRREHPSVLLWRRAPGRMVGLIVRPDYLERQWLAGPGAMVERQNIKVALIDQDGRTVLSQFDGAPAQRAIRTAADTRLPWALHVVSANPAGELQQVRGRQRLVLVGLALIVVVMVGGAYFIARALNRELVAARVQSDFVAAVSHEFRTPLTSVRQLSELLATDRAPNEERRRTYYQMLMHESQRLQRLVEGLLDFGRMEAGAAEYRMEPIDSARFVHDIVEEFQRETADRGYGVELSDRSSGTVIRGDREALGRALWNLLDNAVKYSPDCRTVWVDLGTSDTHLLLAVRDRGAGIPPEERETIFRKFVRGSAAQLTGAKGTGIGLAMVHHIVEGHNGTIHVDSEPGTGTTFTVTVPREG